MEKQLNINDLPVHTRWAFNDKPIEKANTNRETYNKLKGYFKYLTKREIGEMKPDELETLKENYTVYIRGKTGYSHQPYEFLSNPFNLSNRHLALYADGGNLCFGYRGSYPNIIVHTD